MMTDESSRRPAGRRQSGWGGLANRVSPKRALPILCLLGSCACGLCAHVLEDGFEGTDELAGAPVVESKAVWESGGNRQSAGITRDTDGFGGSSVLVISNGLVFARFPDVGLEEGESLELSLKFRCSDATVDNASPLRIGLANNSDGQPDTGDTQGYWVMSSPGPQGVTSIVLEKNLDSLIGGGADFSPLAAAVPLSYDWKSPHQLVIKVSRISGGAVRVSFQIDDAPEQAFVDSGATVTRFNTLGLRIANNAKSQLLIDDVSLVHGKGQK